MKSDIKPLLNAVCVFPVLFLCACVETGYFLDLDVFKGTSSVSSQEFSAATSSELPEDNVVVFKRVSSEQLLGADGHWRVVEQGRDYDPAQAHLNARRNVNVKSFKKKRELSAHFEPDAKSGQDGTLRVLRIETDRKMKHVARSVNRDQRAGVFDKISSLFSSNISATQRRGDVPVVPRMKPKAFLQRHVNKGDVIVPPALPARKTVQVKMISAGRGVAVSPKILGKDTRFVVPAKKPVSGDVVSVMKLRSAMHSGKTRLVVEVSGSTKYKVVVDTLRDVLQIKIDNARWSIAERGTLNQSPLLGSYAVRFQNDGSVLLDVRLKQDAEVANTMFLQPNDVSYYRIVVDLKSL